MQDQAWRSLGVFVLILVGLKVFLGWNISIIGSVVLTILVSFAMNAVNRR